MIVEIPEPADHALGRSRGGLTTKIHALTDAACRPVLVRLTPGQAGDNPERTDQIARRKAKGRSGGRPPAFCPSRYAQRNTTERGFGRIKQWRGIATRYDKYAITYRGGILLACIIYNHRADLCDTL